MSERLTPTLESLTLLSDGWLKKYELVYRLPDGTTHSYEAVSRKGPEAYQAELEGLAQGAKPVPDAVCIVPILPDDSLLLIREFRYPINSWCVAFPAGLMEPGESLLDCVNQELHEETGYRVRADFDRDPLMPLPQSSFSSVGITEENVQVVLAYVEPDGAAEPEPSEFIETFTLAREEVAHFLETNTTPIGTRAQLLLEAVRRTHTLRQRLNLAQNPLTREDFA